MVEAAFSSLAYGPAALTVDGYLIGLGLPARPVPLGELREIVLEKNTTLDVRDAVWAHLVGRARADEMWVTACLGMALPGLKAAAGRLTAAHPREVGDDITAEMVTAFIRHLREVDVTKPNICSHLVFRARKQAGRERARHLNAAGHLPLDPVEATTPADHDGMEPEDLLAQAVARSVITGQAAHLIRATRLYGIGLAEYARAIGAPEDRLRKRRKAAETRLAAAINEGHISANHVG